jgi:hypothetical protein
MHCCVHAFVVGAFDGWLRAGIVLYVWLVAKLREWLDVHYLARRSDRLSMRWLAKVGSPDGAIYELKMAGWISKRGLAIMKEFIM